MIKEINFELGTGRQFLESLHQFRLGSLKSAGLHAAGLVDDEYEPTPFALCAEKTDLFLRRNWLQ